MRLESSRRELGEKPASLERTAEELKAGWEWEARKIMVEERI